MADWFAKLHILGVQEQIGAPMKNLCSHKENM